MHTVPIDEPLRVDEPLNEPLDYTRQTDLVTESIIRPDSYDRALRERCCQRFMDYFTITMVLMVIGAGVTFGVARSQSDAMSDQIQFITICVLTGFANLYMLIVLCRILYSCCTGEECIICRCCVQSPIIEDAQRAYEEQNPM